MAATESRRVFGRRIGKREKTREDQRVLVRSRKSILCLDGAIGHGEDAIALAAQPLVNGTCSLMQFSAPGARDAARFVRFADFDDPFRRAFRDQEPLATLVSLRARRRWRGGAG